MTSAPRVNRSGSYRLRRDDGELKSDEKRAIPHAEIQGESFGSSDEDRVLQGLVPDTGLQYFHKVKSSLSAKDISLLQMQPDCGRH